MRAQLYLLVFVVASLLLHPALAEEIRGICFAADRGGYGGEPAREQLQKIKELGGNWIAINDHAWMGSVNEPALRFGRAGRSPEGNTLQQIKDAHAAGLKILIKPHIWSRDFHGNNKWHGDIRMTSEADWDAFFASYTSYLLENARLAQEGGADAFCVGVEYEGTVDQEARWRKLITDVRGVYKGPICYSAAFLEWQKINWWDAVDVISITAYWPVATTENPTDDEIRAAWDKIYAELDPFAAKWNKGIVLGELGYTASPKAAKEPWSHDYGEAFEQQARLYRIAIEESRKRPYLKGVFLWKWFTADPGNSRWGRDPYTLQDKPLTLEAVRGLWR